MLKLSLMEIKALGVLFKSAKGLDAFSFFSRLNTSFSDFSKVLRSLCDKNLILEDSTDFFVITQEGAEQVALRDTQKKIRPWRTVPKRFIVNKLSTSDCYTPSLCLLDKKTFNTH